MDGLLLVACDCWHCCLLASLVRVPFWVRLAGAFIYWDVGLGEGERKKGEGGILVLFCPLLALALFHSLTHLLSLGHAESSVGRAIIYMLNP